MLLRLQLNAKGMGIKTFIMMLMEGKWKMKLENYLVKTEKKSNT